MKMLRITLEGKTYDVGVEVLDQDTSPVPAAAAPFTDYIAHTAPADAPAAPTAPPSPQHAAVQVAAGCRMVTSPMAGHVFKCIARPGDTVAVNQVVVVLDAMKMETPVVSPVAGTVRTVHVREGDAVDEGHPLVEIETAG